MKSFFINVLKLDKIETVKAEKYKKIILKTYLSHVFILLFFIIILFIFKHSPNIKKNIHGGKNKKLAWKKSITTSTSNHNNSYVSTQ
jgi:hypothetical protein